MHKAGSRAASDVRKDGLAVHSGGRSTVKNHSRQQLGPRRSKPPALWSPVCEVDLVVTQDHFRPHAADQGVVIMMCFRKHIMIFSDLSTPSS